MTLRFSNLSLVLATTLASAGVQAAGFPDPSFSGDGVFVSALGGNHALSDGFVDASGRYVGVGGRTAFTPDGVRGGMVIRVTRTGEPDLTFNGTGDVFLPPPPGETVLAFRAGALQPDGKIVAAGFIAPGDNLVGARPYICRFLANGQLDPAFGGGDGCVAEIFRPFAEEDRATDVAIQSDGRILILGESKVPNDNPRPPAIMRLLNDGTRDLCFGQPACQTGSVVLDPQFGDDAIVFNAIEVAPDGKIVLAGRGYGPMGLDMIVARLTSGGAPDLAFGNQGSRTIAFELGGDDVDTASAAAVLPNGSIVVAGTANDGANGSRRAAIAKLTSNGVLDIFFGPNGNGRSTTYFTDVTLSNAVGGIVVQEDGKIVVGGTSYLGLNFTNGDYAAWRVTPSGIDDDTFGFGGRITVTTGDGEQNQQVVDAIDLDDDGIVLFGYNRPFNQAFPKSAMVRLDQDVLLRDGFED